MTDEMKAAEQAAREPAKLTLLFMQDTVDWIGRARDPYELKLLSEAAAFAASIYSAAQQLAVAMSRSTEARAVALFALLEDAHDITETFEAVVQAELNAAVRLGAPANVTDTMTTQLNSYYKRRYGNDDQGR